MAINANAPLPGTPAYKPDAPTTTAAAPAPKPTVPAKVQMAQAAPPDGFAWTKEGKDLATKAVPIPLHDQLLAAILGNTGLKPIVPNK